MKAIIHGVEYDTEASRLIDARVLPERKGGSLWVEELWRTSEGRHFLVRGPVPTTTAFPIEVQRAFRRAKEVLERHISQSDETVDREDLQDEVRESVPSFIQTREQHLGPDPGTSKIVPISKSDRRSTGVSQADPGPEAGL
jgi:hypothetical protein